MTGRLRLILLSVEVLQHNFEFQYLYFVFGSLLIVIAVVAVISIIAVVAIVAEGITVAAEGITVAIAVTVPVIGGCGLVEASEQAGFVVLGTLLHITGNGDGDGVAFRRCISYVGQVFHAVYTVAVNADKEIVGADTCLFGGAVFGNADNIQTCGSLGWGSFFRAAYLIYSNADTQPAHAAFFDYLHRNVVCISDWNCKAQTFVGAGGIVAVAVLKGVDAHQIAVYIKQTAAGIAAGDRSVMLDVIHSAAGVAAVHIAGQAGHDAAGDGVEKGGATGI